MFINDRRLDHLLRPVHYYDPQHYQVEIERLFRPSWQFVCTTQEIRKPGDFVTLELFGVPLIIRNFDGEFRAFYNVCPHRHSKLTCQAQGNCPVMKCQYHGWEFNAEGGTGRIPDAKSFRPWDRENARLTSVRLERCGDLLFATLDDSLCSLAEWLDPLYDEISKSFAEPMWRMAKIWEFDTPCNWKVPTENTLESYHVSEVHPNWMNGLLPDEAKSTHQMTPRYTTLEYYDDAGSVRQQAKILKRFGGTPTHSYRHWHVHPNLAVCMTDTFCYLATCQPTSPTTARLRTRMFPLWGTRRDPYSRLLRQVAWRIGRNLMMTIFNEDRDIFGAQQGGLEASRHPGVISVREERIFQFQQYVIERCGLAVAPNEDADRSHALASTD